MNKDELNKLMEEVVNNDGDTTDDIEKAYKKINEILSMDKEAIVEKSKRALATLFLEILEKCIMAREGISIVLDEIPDDLAQPLKDWDEVSKILMNIQKVYFDMLAEELGDE